MTSRQWLLIVGILALAFGSLLRWALLKPTSRPRPPSVAVRLTGLYTQGSNRYATFMISNQSTRSIEWATDTRMEQRGTSLVCEAVTTASGTLKPGMATNWHCAAPESTVEWRGLLYVGAAKTLADEVRLALKAKLGSVIEVTLA